MAEKVTLKVMKCPTCGANLKAVNNSDAITCVYCGNTIVPVAEASPAVQREAASGILKVEIKTSSSALAYLEQLFEEYDWDSFAYAQTISIAEIDKLVNSLKSSSADDKNTWFACFKAKSVPFIHKVAGCQKMLTSVIAEYKKDNLDAYSKFDAYKRIAAMISSRKGEILAELEKITAKAAKYGATSTEISGLTAEIDNISRLADVTLYSSIEAIPEVQTFIQEKNAKIAAELAAAGIHADTEYAKAKALIDQQHYVEALNVLRTLKGYADTNALIKKINQYYLLVDILEIEGKLYYYKTENNTTEKTFSLYPTADGKIGAKPLIKNISKIITNYADILYYIDSSNRLRQYNFSTQTNTKLLNASVMRENLYEYNYKVYLLSEDNYYNKDLISLDLPTGKVFYIVKNIKRLVSFGDGKLVYTKEQKGTEDQHSDTYDTCTFILNLDAMHITSLSHKKVTIHGYVDNCVVYTLESPNKYNLDLYIKSLTTTAQEKLLEHNILEFCGIISGKLFYYIGNSRDKTLININCDGSGRKEWPQNISTVLLEQGGWVYFIRKAGYNAILCKARLDGSQYKIIAADIEEFIEIKNGYLYYINDEDSLVKVRMDGSNLQELCQNVKKVLCVQEDKIVFVSIDDKTTLGSYEQVTIKVIKSIYAVDFSGSGKIKLAYNIKEAETYDDNTVYYLAAQDSNASDGTTQSIDVLYKLEVNTYSTTQLLETNVPKAASGCLLPFAIFVVVFGILLMFMGIATAVPTLTIFSMLIALIGGGIALGSYLNKNE